MSDSDKKLWRIQFRLQSIGGKFASLLHTVLRDTPQKANSQQQASTNADRGCYLVSLQPNSLKHHDTKNPLIDGLVPRRQLDARRSGV